MCGCRCLLLNSDPSAHIELVILKHYLQNELLIAPQECLFLLEMTNAKNNNFVFMRYS